MNLAIFVDFFYILFYLLEIVLNFEFIIMYINENN